MSRTNIKTSLSKNNLKMHENSLKIKPKLLLINEMSL